MHIIFESSSESGSIDAAAVDDGKCDEDLTAEAKADDDEEDEEDDEGDTEKTPTNRSAYIGCGNVLAVRASRKLAGLNDSFPRSEPLISQFADYQQAAGASQKDIANKAISIYVNW